MIETKFIKSTVKEFQISEYISESLKNVGFAKAELHKTPLGEKVVIHASRPGLIVGRKGENIQKLTKALKAKFKLENPQIEIIEVEQPMLNAKIVAEIIASSLERFGSSKFKGIGHKAITDVMGAGALGVEILISGKIPSSRAKRWRFYQGYLKKSGDIAVSGIRKAYAQAALKTGIVGIQVKLTPPDLVLPDTVIPLSELIGELKLSTKKISVENASEPNSENSSEENKTNSDSKENYDKKTKSLKKASEKKVTKKKVVKKQSSRIPEDKVEKVQ
jgi:small subunit ribosomal protein S3